MKKWRIGAVFALAVVALVGSTTAYAAGYGGGHHGWYANHTQAVSTTPPSWPGSCWRDTDGDGATDTWSGPCADEDGDGVCDLCGRTGYGYVDADGNGICDNYGTGRAGGGHHSGRHFRW